MKISVIVPADLGPAEFDRWRELHASQPRLASPFFAPEFTLAAAGARPQEVRLAVLERGGRIDGFFPFQARWGMGMPVGGRFSDHHGVIAVPGLRWDWQELLRAARLSWWKFNHLPAWQQPPGVEMRGTSPGLDLSRGFASWHAGRLHAGSPLASLPRKLRKLERELGPVRFEANARDRGAFEAVLRLKSEQCRRTGQDDYFAWPWARELVDRVRHCDSPGFGGRLSTLHAGDTLVAAHFGMRSSRTWHWWFPVYSREHHRYSPGAQLLLLLAQRAADTGHGLLDLGLGDEPYKAVFADSATPLVQGVVARSTPLSAARSAKRTLVRWLGIARRPAVAVRRS